MADVADFFFANSGWGRTMERSVGDDGDVGGAGASHGVDVRNTSIAESAALLVSAVCAL
jgi:hypothetical protein